MKTIQEQNFVINNLKKVIQEQERKLNKLNKSLAETLQEKQIAIFGSLNKTQSLFNDGGQSAKVIDILQKSLNQNKIELRKQTEYLNFLIDTQNSQELF